MITSHSCASSAARIPSAVSTRCQAGVKPPFRNSRRSSRASSSESSISSTRSGLATLGPFGWPLVEQQPVEAKLSHRLAEVLEPHRLSHVAVRPQPVALHQVALLPRGGQYHHWEALGPIVGTDLAQ